MFGFIYGVEAKLLLLPDHSSPFERRFADISSAVEKAGQVPPVLVTQKINLQNEDPPYRILQYPVFALTYSQVLLQSLKAGDTFGSIDNPCVPTGDKGHIANPEIRDV
ncbi:uncharacterized protein EAE97_011090 [Botrytis byssoidea]|uniref:Uncharacterized protein n=1 Tax=Botrytis byssoidea TaxID=139641 RepID=A0A9P5LIC6_9HELO|nr:uncharacterized protein EAE97_011090 [Botrytis byssoidea]KAF7922348.1 hypothetical protein EAE97_011090 [Botrytis byssoidea]